MSNKDNKYTFKELLKEYKIVIPIIQREYAQGRNTPRARKVRREFIRTIKEHLKRKNENGNNDFHLDFIFGVVKDDGKEVFTLENEKQKIMLIVERKEQQGKRLLIPIDGQQRLTLLFLLYYYLGVRAGENLEYLKNFTYEVRDSSRDFIEKLVKETRWKDHIENIKCDEKDKQGCLSEWIRNQLWFLPGWEKDPTIQSMLTVLDEIHRQFKEEKDFKGLYDRLKSITFDFMDMEDYNLDEELYIKLNSTGRQLTELEIFKAEFQKLLRELGNNFKNEHKKFQNKIDNDWMDTFWKHFKYEQNGYYAVDATMLNFFYYMIEMLLFEMLEPPQDEKKSDDEAKNKLNVKFYGIDLRRDRWWDHISLWEIFEMVKNEDKEDKNKNKNEIFEIFKNWLDALFYALDNLENIHTLCDCIFHSGSLEEITPNDWKKVAIWTDNPNLLERVIFNYRYRFGPDKDADFKLSSIDNEKLKEKIKKTKGQIFNQLTLAEKILLYTLIKSVHNKRSNNEILYYDILRLARNIVWSVNKTDGIEQRLNPTGKNVHYILRLFKHIFDKSQIHLLEKSKLKEKNLLFGNDYLNIPEYRYDHEFTKQNLIKDKPHIKCHIYALENHPYLKGDLRIFLHDGNNGDIINNLEDYTKIFYGVFKQDDTVIIPALISVALELEDRRLNAFNYKNDPDLKFLGSKGYWGYLLHSLPEKKKEEENDKSRLSQLRPIWKRLLKKVMFKRLKNPERNVGSILMDIVDEHRNTYKYGYNDWQYYYLNLKYNEFYQNKNSFVILPSFLRREPYDWFRAELTESKNPGSSSHLNPFIYTVWNGICGKGNEIKKGNITLKRHDGRYRWKEDFFYSRLELKNGNTNIKIKIKTDWDEDKKEWVAKGWEIKIEGSEEIVNRLINIYHLEQQPEPKEDKKNTYILPMKDNKDLIDTLVDFITKVLNSEGIP